MWMYIGIAVLVLVGALLIFIAMRPERFRVERGGHVSAPPDAVFPLINDFHEWTRWSPWEKKDPNLKSLYGGPPAGPGAVYSWIGNKNIGEGRMTILESRPGELVSIRLEFVKPFKATNETNFRLTPADGGTRVHWSMDGKNSFTGKAISAFMDMDKMIGKDFEQGLANLNTAAQAKAQGSI